LILDKSERSITGKDVQSVSGRKWHGMLIFPGVCDENIVDIVKSNYLHTRELVNRLLDQGATFSRGNLQSCADFVNAFFLQASVVSAV